MRRRILPLLILALTGLLLVGCSPFGAFGDDSGTNDSRSTLEMKWYSTERGDVKCTDSALPYSMEQHDCDWSTLGKRPEGAEVDSGLPAQWIRTADGEVWCLVNPVSHGGSTSECDWSTIGKRVNSGRLPTFEDGRK